MSLRWRCDGTLICGAKSEPRACDQYIGDRLHYHLSQILKVIKPDPDEKTSGLWHWVLGASLKDGGVVGRSSESLGHYSHGKWIPRRRKSDHEVGPHGRRYSTRRLEDHRPHPIE